MQQQQAFIQTISGGRNRDGGKGTRGLTTEAANHFFKLGLDESGVETDSTAWATVWHDIISLQELLLWFGFCTTNQGFMGRVPHESRSDDIIVVFLGGRTPYVLRKYKGKNKYYLGGECCKCSNFLLPIHYGAS